MRDVAGLRVRSDLCRPFSGACHNVVRSGKDFVNRHQLLGREQHRSRILQAAVHAPTVHGFARGDNAGIARSCVRTGAHGGQGTVRQAHVVRVRLRMRINANFALINNTTIINVTIFDRIFDGNNMTAGGAVHVFNHRRQGR